MDREKVCQNYRVCWGLAFALFWLLIPSPVAAYWRWDNTDGCVWTDFETEEPSCNPMGAVVPDNEYGVFTTFSAYDEGLLSLETTCDILAFNVQIETEYGNEEVYLWTEWPAIATLTIEPGYMLFFFNDDDEDCTISSVQIGEWEAGPTPTPEPTESPIQSLYEQSLPPNDAVHVNDAGIMSGELPMPLPRMPGAINMPDVDFPYVDFSEWPSVTDGRESVGSTINGELYEARDIINEQYNRARDAISAVQETTQGIRNFVGNPMTSVTAQSDSRVVTVNSMVSEMAQSVSYSLGYLRAVSNLGPMGLDLVFVFIGLGWVLFMNLVEWILTVIIWILKALAGAINFGFRILELVMQLIRTIRALILI